MVTGVFLDDVDRVESDCVGTVGNDGSRYIACWWLVCSVVKLKDVFTSKLEGRLDWEVDVECCLIFPVYDLRLGMVC